MRPRESLHAEILGRTYKAEMNVIVHNGLTMVAEMPHRYGRSEKRDDELAALHETERHRHA